MDVHLTKDGVPIVMHDPTIDRTTEGWGRIGDMTLADLSRFSTHSTSQSYREPIPTLAQVLDLAKSKYVRVGVKIELDADGRHYPGIEHKVLSELTSRDILHEARILSSDFDTLRRVRAIHPGTISVALLSADYFRDSEKHEDAVVEELAPFADGIALERTIPLANLIEAAHQRQMFVEVWTVDTEEEMAQFAQMGVDSIATNRPDVFNQAFGR